MKVESLGFRTDLMVRRLTGSTVTDEGDHIVVRTPDNPTFYWGNFLLLAQPPTGAARVAGALRLDVPRGRARRDRHRRNDRRDR